MKIITNKNIKIILFIFIAMLSFHSPAKAIINQAITVDTTSDEFNASPNSTCSLREAIYSINNTTSYGGCTYQTVNEVKIPPGTYELSITGTEENCMSGDLDISSDIIITGLGNIADDVIIDAMNLGERVFDIRPGAGRVVTLNNLRITNGADLMGGGIYVSGISTLNLNDILFNSNNSVADGGGLYSTSTSTINITSSSFISNTANANGGGVYHSGGELNITNSTFYNNNALGATGGGLVTFSGSDTNLTHVTFVNNMASDSLNGHSYHNGGNLTVANTIAVDSCAGNAPSAEYTSLESIASAMTCGYTNNEISGSIVTTPPNYYGGKTPSLKLDVGSAALGIASQVQCADVDQRGYARDDSMCDIGSYQATGEPASFISASTNLTGNKVIRTFNNPLDETVTTDANDFIVLADGVPLTLGVGISSDKVTLTCNPSIMEGQDVQAFYDHMNGQIKDVNGNVVYGISGTTVTNITDNTKPSKTSLAIDGGTLEVTYNEALDSSATEPSIGDYTLKVNGSTSSLQSLSISGSKVILMLSYPVSAGESVTLAYTVGANPVLDLAGNSALAFSESSVTNNTDGDVDAPTLQNASIDGDTVILSYNEDLTTSPVPENGDFSIVINSSTNANATGVSISGSDITIMLDTTVISSDSAKISYTGGANKIKDLAGNFAANLVNESLTNNTVSDTNPPNFQGASIEGNMVLIGYDETLATSPVPENSDYSFMINGSTTANVSSISISGTEIMITLDTSVISTDSVTFSYTGGSNKVKDTAGNIAVNLSNQTVTNNTISDTDAPIFQGASIDGDMIVISYDEPLASGSVPANNDYSFVINGSVNANATSVSINNSSVNIVLDTTVINTDSVTFSYTGGSNKVKDTAGNVAVNLSNKTVTNDTIADTDPPILQDSGIDGDMVTLQFDENIVTSSVPAKSDFNFIINSSTNAIATALAISGNTIMITLNTSVISTDLVDFSYSQGTNKIKDISGNAVESIPNQNLTNNTTPDTTSPTYLGSVVNGMALYINYDEPLLSSSAPSTSDYMVLINGTTNVAVNAVSISGNAVVLTLATAVNYGDTAQFSYSHGGTVLSDLSGNSAAALSNKTVQNSTPDPNSNNGSSSSSSDTNPPSIQSAGVNKDKLTIKYSEEINTNADYADFRVSANGTNIQTKDISVSNDIAVLTLESPVQFEEAVLLSYNKDSIKAIKDLAGNKASNVSNLQVTNNTPDKSSPVLEDSFIDGDKIILDYNKQLSANNGINIVDFTVITNGANSEIFSIFISGDKINIQLTKKIDPSDLVKLSYLPSQNIFIDDRFGNHIVPLNNISIRNNTKDTDPPVLTLAEITNGKIVLTFNETLSNNTLSTSEFNVLVNGTSVSLSNIEVENKTIKIDLEKEVKKDDTVTISFTASGGLQIKDLAGNLAKDFRDQEVINNTVEALPSPTENTLPGEATSEENNTPEEDENGLLNKLKVIDKSVNFYDIPDKILRILDRPESDSSNYIFAGSELSFEITDQQLANRIITLGKGNEIKVKIPNINGKLSVVNARLIKLSKGVEVIKTEKIPLKINEGKTNLVLSAGTLNLGKINVTSINNSKKADPDLKTSYAPVINTASVLLRGGLTRVLIKGKNFYNDFSLNTKVPEVSILPSKKTIDQINISSSSNVITMRIDDGLKDKNGYYLINIFTPFGQASEVIYLRKTRF